MLGKETIKLIPCAGCGRPAKDHSFDVVLLLQLTRNSTNEECTKFLQPIGAEMEADGIDGITLVETKEKFRVAKS